MQCRGVANMSSRETQSPKTIVGEMFVQPAVRGVADALAVAPRADTISSQSRRDCNLESTAEDASCEGAQTSLLTLTNVDAPRLIRVQQFEVVAKRRTSRIAFKAQGRFLFLDL